jgi:predicted nucleotidyltransferase
MERHAEAVGNGALAEAVRRLAETLRPERIYLFGSQARGDATVDSDYDLLVVVSGSGKTPHSKTVEAYRAVKGVPIAMDVLVWTRESFERQISVVASLPATVLREGRLLYAD